MFAFNCRFDVIEMQMMMIVGFCISGVFGEDFWAQEVGDSNAHQLILCGVTNRYNIDSVMLWTIFIADILELSQVLLVHDLGFSIRNMSIL